MSDFQSSQAAPALQTCPWCMSEIDAAATVCKHCGARKTTASSRYGGAELLLRFSFWLCGPGGVLVGAWIVIPYVIWLIATNGNEPWYTVFGSAGKDLTRAWPSLKAVPDAVAAMALGAVTWFSYYIFKPVNAVWVRIFGRLSDPVWVR